MEKCWPWLSYSINCSAKNQWKNSRKIHADNNLSPWLVWARKYLKIKTQYISKRWAAQDRHRKHYWPPERCLGPWKTPEILTDPWERAWTYGWWPNQQTLFYATHSYCSHSVLALIKYFIMLFWTTVWIESSQLYFNHVYKFRTFLCAMRAMASKGVQLLTCTKY